MRRLLFATFGLLELAVAGALVYLVRQLPGTADVERSFENAEQVTYRAGHQARLFRQQITTLRRPELQELAERLQTQTHSVATLIKSRSIDYDTVGVMRDALGDVAQGLDSLAQTLDPERIGQLGAGLGETAAFLDQKLVPSAQQAAKQLDEVTRALRTDAQRLQALVRHTPFDLKAVGEVHEGLGRFGEGLERMHATLDPRRFHTLRDGFSGLEDSLTTGAEQVERLSGYTYPVVTFHGLKPNVERRQFWPEGDKIAGGMRKAAAGAEAAREELEAWGEDLPKLRASVAESARVVYATREALASALRQRDKIEPLLKDMPAHVGRLAESLPELSGDLARILRDTRHLRDVADALRHGQKGIQDAIARWPEIRRMLSRSAVLLRSTRDQLDHTLDHRDEFESQLQQTSQVAEAAATLLPLFTHHLGEQLEEQEEALDELGQSIDAFGTAIPVYAKSASSLLQTVRWLIALVAGLICLHGVYLTATAAAESFTRRIAQPPPAAPEAGRASE